VRETTAHIGVDIPGRAKREWNWQVPEGECHMIEIAAAACMISAPNHCRDVSLIFDANSTATFACMTQGQIQLAQWTVTHPNWRITRFTCREAGTVGKI
jgi:hypothetical protein